MTTESKRLCTFFEWLDERRRKKDLEVRWSRMKLQANSLEEARQAFYLYACTSPPWDRAYPGLGDLAAFVWRLK